MRKVIFSAAIAAALGAGAFAGFRALNPAERQLSDVELANVEALADIELVTGGNFKVTFVKPDEMTCEDGGTFHCPLGFLG